MQFNFNGVSYRAEFMYSRNERKHNGHNQNDEIWERKALGPGVDTARISTYCNISSKPIGQNNWNGISTGISIKDRRDRFDKVEGQKIALVAAMENNPVFTKQLRTVIWHNFFVQHKAGQIFDYSGNGIDIARSKMRAVSKNLEQVLQ